MIDHYKTLNLAFGASETEIKKRFRELARTYHPDQNGGSKKSEEIFKQILIAYETLGNKDKRAIYNKMYNENVQKTKASKTNHYHSNYSREESYEPQVKNREYEKNEKVIMWEDYIVGVILAIVFVVYIITSNRTTTTGNRNADEQLENQIPENRPQTGEIKFKKQ